MMNEDGQEILESELGMDLLTYSSLTPLPLNRMILVWLYISHKTWIRNEILK